ncbi:hypothetical protein [Pacificoceanicola onchidii]|uniref:hypothetical protein n=1 Tax=Pacificoceanicola onchidii TaxID=2562685 RepID=UPI0010A4B939|nr:hypothetical protein [Pacificoceanicola onchidii]
MNLARFPIDDSALRVIPADLEGPVDAVRCRDLWAFVLMQSWLDSFNSGSWTASELRRDPVWGRGKLLSSARAWFGTADFADVVHLAGLDPGAVMSRWRLFQEDFIAAGEPLRWWQTVHGERNLYNSAQTRKARRRA